jgi:hypothetical protein
MNMKKWLLGIGAWALMATAAVAQGFAPGSQIVSPMQFPGQFPYIAGPQSTAVNAEGGTFTCTSSGTIVVANTKVTGFSDINITLKTAGGTPALNFISSITPGTGFSVTCGSGDTSTYNYLIIG